MKKTYFWSGAAILLLLASSCEKENTDSLNPSQFQNPGSLSSSPIFNVTFGGLRDVDGVSASAYGASATKSKDGGYIIAGSTNSNDGDVSGNHGMDDGWLVKIDRFGNKLWQKTYGGTRQDGFHSIASTTDGGYIMAGETLSDDGDISGYHGSVQPDFWVVKTDAGGNIIWSKAIGNPNVDFSEIASSIIETSDGNYVVVGTSDVRRGYAVKLDKSGNVLWEKVLDEGALRNEFTSVLEDSDGNYIATGFAIRRENSNDFWLVKFSKNGDVLIHRQYGGLSSEQAFSATIAQDGAYILAGQKENIDGNTSDIMVIKVNKAGTCLWERVLKSPDVESASSIIALDNGGFLIAKNTTLPDRFTIFGSWIKLDHMGNKLEEQKVADQTYLAFLIEGFDSNFITGGAQREMDKPQNMSVIGFQIP